MDLITALKQHGKGLKNYHGYLDQGILDASTTLKNDSFTQKISIELQKIEESAREAGRSAVLKNDKRGVVDAHPQLKEALLARQGEITVSEFTKTDQRTGLITQDRSVMHISSDGFAVSCDQEDLPFKIPDKGNSTYKISDYEANILTLAWQYKHLEKNLGLLPSVQTPANNSEPEQRKSSVAVPEMMP